MSDDRAGGLVDREDCALPEADLEEIVTETVDARLAEQLSTIEELSDELLGQLSKLSKLSDEGNGGKQVDDVQETATKAVELIDDVATRLGDVEDRVDALEYHAVDPGTDPRGYH